MKSSKACWSKQLLLLCSALLCTFSVVAAADVSTLPKPSGFVSDFAHVLSDSDQSKLEEICTKVEQQLNVQVALVTIDTLSDKPVRDFALDLSRKWGVGERKTNQGVLLLLVIKDHKSDIEIGRGLEPFLTDGFSGSVLRTMRPELRSGNYGAALQTATREMANQIAQGKRITWSDESGATSTERKPQNTGGGTFVFVILGIFLVLWLFRRQRQYGGRRMRSGNGGGFWVFPSNVFSDDERRSGSSWGNGGGFGNDGGGSGGFGGFSGGDFGGGGASSDW